MPLKQQLFLFEPPYWAATTLYCTVLYLGSHHTGEGGQHQGHEGQGHGEAGTALYNWQQTAGNIYNLQSTGNIKAAINVDLHKQQ